MSSSAQDYELLRAWRAQDGAAGNQLVRRHFASVFSFLRSKVPEHVDDLVQRTFLACVESVDRIDESRSFRAYLFGIARRQLIYHYRRDRQHSDRFDPMLESVHDASRSPSQHAAAREARDQVLEALRRLPLDLQITLELHYWEAMKTDEIADALALPPGTVRGQLQRGRARLREALEESPSPHAMGAIVARALDEWATGLRETVAAREG